MLNGSGLRVVLWLSGCSHKCKGCQNIQTWDCNSGILFDENAKEELFRELNKDYISGVTVTGGDPLHENNLDEVLNLINEMRVSLPNKTIWLYSGYTWEEIMHSFEESEKFLQASWKESAIKRYKIVSKSDVFIDGRYVEELRDVSLKWRGSSNQNVIDVRKSLEQGKMVLYCN